MKKKIFYSRLILASRSPARRELMMQLNVLFECYASGYEEDMNAFRSSSKLAKFLALEKAKFIAAKFPDAIIIGADTFVVVSGKKVGKPSTRREAMRMVEFMSGKWISVYSGVAVIATDPGGKIFRKKVSAVRTKLKIKKMSLDEIRLLASQKDALEISGSFSIEGEGGKMVEKIVGDYENVIGLPMFAVRDLLKKVGFKVVG